MSTGLNAIRDAAREYVSALEARRVARREMTDAADRIAKMRTTTDYRAAVSRTRKALARMERLLAIESRVVRIEASK